MSYTERDYLIYLSAKLRLTYKRLSLILSKYSTLAEAVSDNLNRIDGQKWISGYKNFDQSALSAVYEGLNSQGVSVLTLWDKDYPTQLKDLPDTPVLLYFKGSLDVLRCLDEAVTVVGSRNFTKYSESVLDKILAPVCRQGISVVSGLALGIDGLAHNIAISNNSKTVAVIGSGLDTDAFSPKQNLELYARIVADGGLVLSEYPLGTQASVYTFPQRNRLLAGLTKVTWVVEASINSGSLITATQAHKLGRVVATTPGSLFEPNLSGNIELLRGGAKLISNPDDIYSLFNITVSDKIESLIAHNFSDEKESVVYASLNLNGKSVDVISSSVGLNSSEVSSVLTMLELQGYAVNLGQNIWRKV